MGNQIHEKKVSERIREHVKERFEMEYEEYEESLKKKEKVKVHIPYHAYNRKCAKFDCFTAEKIESDDCREEWK